MRKNNTGQSRSFLVGCAAVSIFLAALSVRSSNGAELPTGSFYTNTIGMKLARVEAGSFRMGFEEQPLADELLTDKGNFANGDFDEHPAHKVQITKAFYMGVCEVTNAQYEQFDPEHKSWRGRHGFSKADDEAVIFVSWYDAVNFCRWLREKEGLSYRLGTEAEWEYACRAGSDTAYHTGRTLPDEFSKSTEPALKVGAKRPNKWGLYDMHGNVEEWCHDWYGPYEPTAEVDPVGRADGDFKVTRGGSHSTGSYYLRSSNRSGSLPQDRQWLIGFRVALGQPPRTQPLPVITEPYQRYVRQSIVVDIDKGPDSDKPYFKGPRLFVKIPADATGPLFGLHNHFTAITECPNGDLLAAWFNCMSETGRELGIAASRLRYGREQWEPASVFWDAPDRNDHTHTLWHDGNGTIYHFNGLGVIHRSIAMLLRKSSDNGATWSKARLIYPDHDRRTNYVVESVFRASDGRIVVPCDGRGGSVLIMSNDEGRSWYDAGGRIRGIHAAAAQLKDGRLLAFGRKGAIEGRMPASVSEDMGKNWQYHPSEFQPVNLGQRPILLRLKEGPLLFASFCKKMMVADASGSQRPISGLFAAVSTDEGKTWPYKRLVSDDGPTRDIETMDGHPVAMDSHFSEFVGYLSVCQTANNLIHVLSSRNHYTFNLKWLTTRPPAAPVVPGLCAQGLAAKKGLASLYKPKGPPSQSKWGWNFRGAGESKTVSILPDGLLKIRTADDQEIWYRSDKADGYEAVDQKTGFSAEIKVQVLSSEANHRGVDFELYDGAGSRYAITITDTGVYWYEGLVFGSVFLDFEEFGVVAEGLDNTDGMHTYRLSVRADRVVQIYRDEKLIGLRRYEYRTPRDAYILFGAGQGVEALVDYVSYDLSGPYQP